MKLRVGVSHDGSPESIHIVYFSVYEIHNKTKNELKGLIRIRIKNEQLSMERTAAWLAMVEPFIGEEGSEL